MCALSWRVKLLSTGAINTRAVERLARKLYEANHPGDTPWTRRGWEVRQEWQAKARNRIETVGFSLDRFDFWHEIKSLFGH
jgi:hypothetical protein